jgi:hypothetical protein
MNFECHAAEVRYIGATAGAMEFGQSHRNYPELEDT